MAGPKGSGLSLIIECLTSLMAGNPVLVPALGGAAGTNMNGLAIAVDTSAFLPEEEFRSEVDALAAAIVEQPTQPGTDRLIFPGERGKTEEAARRIEGIPVPGGVWTGLATAAAQAKLEMPMPVSG